MSRPAIQGVIVCCGLTLGFLMTASSPFSPAALQSIGVLHAEDGAGNQMATGNAHITISTTPTILEQFSFNAIKHGDGRVTGQWQAFRESTGIEEAHGSVTCMGIDGNTARIGGVITYTNPVDGHPVGTILIWTVVDNGEGANDPPDLTSQLIIVNEAQRDFHCTAGFIQPLFPTNQGNIQVHD